MELVRKNKKIIIAAVAALLLVLNSTLEHPIGQDVINSVLDIISENIG